MTQMIKAAAWLLLAVASLTGQAQAVNLMQALESAKKHDAQWAAAKARYNAHKHVSDEAKAALKPQITATSSIAYNTYKSDSTQIRVDPDLNLDIDACRRGAGIDFGCAIGQLVGIELTDSTDEKFVTNEIQLAVSQVLFSMSAWQDYKKARILRTQEQINFYAAEQELMVRVAEAYFKALRAQADVSLAQKQEKAIRRQVRLAKRRYNQGVGLENEVLDAEASYDISQGNLEFARASLEQAQLEFAGITGLYAGELNPLSDKLPIVMPEPADPKLWVDKALAHNPKLLALSMHVQVQQREYYKQKAGHYPEVNLYARYKESETSGGQGFTPGSESLNVGIQVKVPLYRGGYTTAATKRALYQHHEARDTFFAKRQQAQTVTRNLHRLVIANVTRVNAWKRAIRSSKRALHATQRSYDNGTRLVSDVIDAENTLLATERDLANGRFDYIINFIKLKQTAGVLSQADFVALDIWLQPQKR